MPQNQSGSQWYWLFAAVSAFGILAAGPLPAQAQLLQMPPASAPAYVQRIWNSSQGMPQNTATAIVQTRDGHIWIGTFGGLCRLDGEGIEVFDTVTAPGLRNNRVSCLFEASDGTLWIGSDQGGVACYRDGRFQPRLDIPFTAIHAITADRSGRILVATSRDLLLEQNGAFQPLHPSVLRQPHRLLRRRSGELLVATGDGIYSVDTTAARWVAGGLAQCLAEVGDRVLVGTAHGLCVLRDGAVQPWQPLSGLTHSVQSLLLASDGALWVGTLARTIRIAPSHLPGQTAVDDPVPPAALLAASEVQASRTFCEDQEGGIWIGHTERGASRLRPAEVVAHHSRQGLPPRGITAVLGDGRGGLFVGTELGLLRRRNGRFEPVPGTEEFRWCRGLALDPDGSLWFGNERGLAHLDAAGPRLVADNSTWPAQQLRAILRDADGTLWLGGDEGLAQLRDGRIEVPPLAEALRGRLVRTLANGPDGALWLGGATFLARIDASRRSQRTWHSGRELPYGEVRTILPRAGDSALIATYGGGLVQVQGDRIVAIDERHGLCDQALCAILPYQDSYCLVSNQGACLLARADLDAVVDGRAATLGCRPLRTTGGTAPEGNGGMQPCAVEVDGRIWYCGIENLFEVLPPTPASQPGLLATRLNRLYLGDTLYPDRGELGTPVGIRAATFELGCCSYDYHAQIRYRWRLLGHADTWTEPRFTNVARFDGLPAGDLTFEAEAIDVDGRSSSAPTRLVLRVPPVFTETRLFRFGLPLALALGAALLIRFGAGRTALRAARLQQVIDERTKELRSSQQLLEQRVAERTRDLQTAMQRQHDELDARQRLERQLLQLQRMESLGQLAGGIAHDFNNLLTVASGSSQLLADEVHTPEGTELCRSIRQACERGRSLTQHLLAVASRQLVTAAHLDLNQLVRDLLPVLRALLGDDIPLQYEATAGKAPVRAAVTQIEQILLNLATNARDAMPRGGRVILRIRTTDAQVHLELQDTGRGMPPEVKERVFEPFFTTKPDGGSHGLGLATVYGITKQLGGEVQIDSAVGKGTTVSITLPRTTEERTEPTAMIPRATPGPLRGHILLAEDQTDVRAVLDRLLRRLGCTVHSAVDGAAAVAALRTSPAAFDAVVSDVVMPGLQGRELVHALRTIRPDLPILFLSGYLDGRLTHHDLHAMGLEILPKPPDSTELARVLQQLLAKTPIRPSPTSPAPAHPAPTAPVPPRDDPRPSAARG